MSQKTLFIDQIIGLSLTALSVANPHAAGFASLASSSLGLIRAIQGFSKDSTAQRCRKKIESVLDGALQSGEIEAAEIERVSILLTTAPDLDRLSDDDTMRVMEAHGKNFTDHLAQKMVTVLPIEATDPMRPFIRNVLGHGIMELREDPGIHQRLMQDVGLESYKMLSALTDFLLPDADALPAPVQPTSPEAEINAAIDQVKAAFPELVAEVFDAAKLQTDGREAMSAGDFEKAVISFRDADKFHTEIASQTKVLRAQALLRAGRPNDAVRHLASAADVFAADRPKDALATRQKAVDRMYEIGRLTGLEATLAAAWLAEDTLRRIDRKTEPNAWRTGQSNLAATLHYIGSQVGGCRGEDLLDRSIAGFESIVDSIDDGETPADQVVILTNYAVALRKRSLRAAGDARAGYLNRALAAILAARQRVPDTLRAIDRAPVLIAEARILQSGAADLPVPEGAVDLERARRLISQASNAFGSAAKSDPTAKAEQANTLVVDFFLAADLSRHQSPQEAQATLSEVYAGAAFLESQGYFVVDRPVPFATFRRARARIAARMTERGIVPSGTSRPEMLAAATADLEAAAELFQSAGRVEDYESTRAELQALPKT